MSPFGTKRDKPERRRDVRYRGRAGIARRPPSLVTDRLPLGTGQAKFALGAKHVAVQAIDPLSATRRDVKVPDRFLDVRRNVVPIKLRVLVSEIGWRSIAELFIHAD